MVKQLEKTAISGFDTNSTWMGSKLEKTEHVSSQFYSSYPSSSKPGMVRKGLFEHLLLCVGMGFDRTDMGAVKIICDQSEDGIFLWPPEVMKCIGRCNLSSNNRTRDIKNKQLHMVGYLIELFFDI